MINSEFLLNLRNLGIVLRAEGGRLICNAPKGVLTPELRTVLKEQKDEILEILRNVNMPDDSPALVLEKIPREGNPQLSFAQQRLWYLDQFQPNLTAYNMSWAFKLTGQIDSVSLQKSLNEIIRRHEVLRTVFVMEDDKPVQIILPNLEIQIPVLDFRNTSITEHEQDVLDYLQNEAKKPFDLSKGPLFHAKLIQIAGDQHVLFIMVHHVIFDGWSFEVFMGELFSLYEAFSTRQSSPLSELSIQYSDYAIWQRKCLEEGELTSQLSYWKEKLGGKLSHLQIPTDYPRPKVQTYNGAEAVIQFPNSLIDGLKEIGRSEGTSLFMVLLTIFKILLFRYTGQEDICIGSPFAGRNQKEIERLIGFFVNTLVLRTKLSGKPVFRILLKKVRDVALEAQANQDVPFEHIVQELNPERDLSRTPLFQIFFNYITTHSKLNRKVNGVEIERFMKYQGEIESKFDLTFYAEDIGGDVQLRLVYNSDLFDAARMAEFLEQFIYLSKQIVNDPDRPITSYSLLTDSVRSILPDPNRDLSIHKEETPYICFTNQAKLNPEHIAVEDGFGHITYGVLNSLSNKLANCLIENGVSDGDIVAVYGHRSGALVWALLGVLKAGATFVILDPSYPDLRVQDYIKAASPKGWLQISAAGVMPDNIKNYLKETACKCVVELPAIDRAIEDKLINQYSSKDPGINKGMDEIAYLSFTSGTTGSPKMIASPLRPLSHFIRWHQEKFNLNESDRFSMLSGIAHDPLLRDIFTPLSIGARLCIPDLEGMIEEGMLAEWMIDSKVTITHLTPAMGQLLTETTNFTGGNSSENKKLTSLRYAFFGGDTLTIRDINRVQTFAPLVQCVNFYGTTETPQAMAYEIIRLNKHIKSSSKDNGFKLVVPLGKGIDGTQLLILNRDNKQAGISEIGEIYIRSPYLAKGYLKDERLTLERFIENPFTCKSNDRLYKTGDLGRYLPDGRVEFAGRSDYQIKIRGFRIEPKEIEALLSSHDAVSQSVVVSQNDSSDTSRLVAYIVLEKEVNVTGTEFRKYLRTKLPNYMIPQNFIELEEIPLTPNGKIDRKSLPTAFNLSTVEEMECVAPRNEAETVLVEVWQELLGVDSVSIHDNFFDLGGHSLLSMQAIVRIAKKTGMRLDLRSFMYNTLGQIAAQHLSSLSKHQVAETKTSDSFFRRIIEKIM